MNLNSPVVASLHSLAKSRRRHSRGIAFATAIAALIAVVGVLAAIDVQFEWKPPLRIILVIGALTFFGVILIKRLRLAKRHDVMEAARTVEAAHPEFGQKLRTALEFSDLPKTATSRESAVFTNRLLDETARDLKSKPWAKLVPGKALWKRRGLALALLAIVTMFATQSADFRHALKRITQPYRSLTYTKIHWKALPTSFDDAHPPRIEFEIEGRPAQPKLLIRQGDEDWKTVELTRRTDGRTWDIVLQGKTEDLQVKVLAGDSQDGEKTILYRPIPKLIDSLAAIEYPDYTGLKNESVAGGDVRALEGSNATWKFTFNTPPVRVTWSVGGSDPVEISAQSSDAVYHASAEIFIGKKTAELAIYDSSDQRLDSWRFEIEGIADKLPQVEIVEPKKDLELISTAEMPIRIRAKDDFGVSEIGLILDAGGERQWILETTLEGKNQRQVSDLASIMLEKYQLKITDNVRIHAYALDRKPRGGPRAVSKLVSIDIKQFQMRLLNGLKDGGGNEGPKPDAAIITDALKKLDDLIAGQRGVLSDVFGAKESYRSTTNPEVTAKATEYSTRQQALGLEAHTVANEWGSGVNIPSDDVMLMSTASEQMNEAAMFLAATDLNKGFGSGDRALSTLLQLRKELLAILMKSPSPDPKPLEDPPVPVADLAKEARRIAAEEKDVASQLAPETIEGNKIEATRRQQEIAFADAGELYTKLIDHPERTDGALMLMDDSEKAVAKADHDLNTETPNTALDDLVDAERNLSDLATFLEAMDLQKLSDTLAKLADEAEKSAGHSKQQKAESAAKSPPSTAPGTASAEAAKSTELTDKILTELAKKAAPDPEAEGEAKSSAANTLEGLAKTTDPKALAGDLAKLAELQKNGGGPEADQLKSETDQRLGAMARDFRDAAAKLNAGRLAELNKAREMAEALKKELAKAGDSNGEGEKPGEKGKGDLPAKDGKQDAPGGTGPTLSRFADTLDEINDEGGLGRLVAPLQKAPFDRSSVPLVDVADQRLLELIEQVPVDKNIASAKNKLPEQSRREIEDYFRDLSDDFGGEVWEAKQ